MSGPIRLRPHHLLCALGFQGKGYSDSFTANMAKIVGQLRAPGGDDQCIDIIGKTDDICAPCPLRHGILCESQPKIDALDAAHGEALGVAPGDRLTWGEAQARMRAEVPPERLDTLCDGCRWLHMGMCRDALRALHETDDQT